ncbi:alpha/beta fold hydrolase [Streptomyces sp. M10(2022)]
MILLHGGYWRYDRMHLTPFAAYLARQGFDVLLPGFRRSGGAGGYPETFDDVTRIVDTLPQGRPYVLAGHCSGGHLALWCAARGLLPPVRAGTPATCLPPSWRWHRSPTSPPPAATASATTPPCDSSAAQPCSRRGCLRWTPDPAARRGHHRRPHRAAARSRRRGGPAHSVRGLRIRAPRPDDRRAARHRPLHAHRTGSAGARAVAGTLEEMSAAFGARLPVDDGRKAPRT